MAKKSKKEEVMKEVSSVDKKIAKLKAVIKKLEDSKQIMAINHNKPQNQIPPITPPQPDNITGNLNNNLKVQQLGKEMFQGEALAEQFAMRGLDNPVSPPGNPIGDELGNMFMQPFSRKKTKQEKVNPTKKAKQGLHSSGRYPSKINMNGDPVKSDTLYLPNKFKKQEGKMIDETDYDVLSKKVKNYKRKLVEDLQDMGRIKLNEQGKPYVVNRKN